MVILSWHASILVLTKLYKSSEKNQSFKEILKVIETRLLQNIKNRIKMLPEKESSSHPYKKWKKETEIWLRRNRKNQNEQF